jgi:hypothetical protein
MAVSAEKIAANQNNSKKSTGPKTQEGKAISRLNARTHGFSGKILCSPYDDPAAAQQRREDLERELNPNNSVMQSWFVDTIAHHTLLVDRLLVTMHARNGAAIKAAIEYRREKQVCEIEDLVQELTIRPDVAVRKLRRTSYGCTYLIDQWRALENEGHHAEFTFSSLRALHTISGHVLIGDRWKPKTPLSTKDCEELDVMSPLWTETNTIVKFRALVDRIAETIPANSQGAWKKHYNHSVTRRNTDIADRPEQFRLGIAAGAVVATFCASQIEELVTLRDTLKQEEAARGDDSTPADYRDAFDGSEDGKLIHRYIYEHKREVSRGLAEIYKLNKWTETQAKTAPNQTQVEAVHEVTESAPPAADVVSEGKDSRNEATDSGSQAPSEAVDLPRSSVHGEVNMNVSPKTTTIDRQ